MDWNAAALMLIGVCMNHMGLIDAVERLIKRRIPVVNCVKCCVFWMALIYNVCTGYPLIPSVAVAFLCSYAALWLELLLGCIDKLYVKCYEKIVSNAGDDTTAEDTDNGHPADSVSFLR